MKPLFKVGDEVWMLRLKKINDDTYMVAEKQRVHVVGHTYNGVDSGSVYATKEEAEAAVPRYMKPPTTPDR